MGKSLMDRFLTTYFSIKHKLSAEEKYANIWENGIDGTVPSENERRLS